MRRSLRGIANRKNAQLSTGPITSSGKLRSRRNALKHGLAAGPLAARFSERRISSLVKSIVGERCTPVARKAAETFARAQLYYERVLSTRKKLERIRARDLELGRDYAAPAVLAKDSEIERLDRYEWRAILNRISAARDLDQALSRVSATQQVQNCAKQSQATMLKDPTWINNLAIRKAILDHNNLR
jgi:hypothetical protein